jgi:hypothetical protein
VVAGSNPAVPTTYQFHKYDVYGVYNADLPSSLIVIREVREGGSSILRVVDYTGNQNDIVYISKYLNQIMVKKGCEYIDFISFGFDEAILNTAGFMKINLESSEIIAPNYFAPFVQENIKINFMADTKGNNRLRI